MKKPKIFVGSSLEGEKIAKAIQVNLNRFGHVTVWTDNVFKLSKSTYDSIRLILAKSDYGIFVLSPDDELTTREKSYYAPRDNVIFELGMFCGALGIENTFIVHPREVNLKLPSDLLGITTARYDLDDDIDITASLGAVCAKIEWQITDAINPKTDISWDELSNLVVELANNLRQPANMGGFVPNIILGITHGGLSVADLLGRSLGKNIPVLSLWADRNIQHPLPLFTHPENNINDYLSQIINDKKNRNILLIDDITRSGCTLEMALSFIDEIIMNKTEKNIKSAVLIYCNESTIKPNYYIRKSKNLKLRMPFAVFDRIKRNG